MAVLPYPIPAMSIINLSAYRFVSLHDLPELRERILERCEALELKGTVLLAPEGINLFLAGLREPIDAFMDWLRSDARFAGLEPKESISDDVPFGRMRVRLKKEIITMRMPTIRPEGGRAPSVAPATLQRWLAQGHDDDGRDVVLLDTRNDYETDVGLFDNAVDYRIGSFTDFPSALAADRARYENKTVVSYLHRRHPLRKSGAAYAGHRHGPRVPAGRRHPEVLRGNRRLALAWRVLCVR